MVLATAVIPFVAADLEEGALPVPPPPPPLKMTPATATNWPSILTAAGVAGGIVAVVAVTAYLCRRRDAAGDA